MLKVLGRRESNSNLEGEMDLGYQPVSPMCIADLGRNMSKSNLCLGDEIGLQMCGQEEINLLVDVLVGEVKKRKRNIFQGRLIGWHGE